MVKLGVKDDSGVGTTVEGMRVGVEFLLPLVVRFVAVTVATGVLVFGWIGGHGDTQQCSQAQFVMQRKYLDGNI